MKNARVPTYMYVISRVHKRERASLGDRRTVDEEENANAQQQTQARRRGER